MKDLRQNKADAVHEHVVNSLLPINSKENIRTTYRKTVFGVKFRKYVKQFAIVTAAGVVVQLLASCTTTLYALADKPVNALDAW